MNNQAIAERASRSTILRQWEIAEATAIDARNRVQSAPAPTQRTRGLQSIEDVAGQSARTNPQLSIANPQLSIGYPNNQLPYPNNQLTYPDNQIADAPQTYGPLRRQSQPYSTNAATQPIGQRLDLGARPSQRSTPYGLFGGSPIEVFVKTLTGDPHLLTQLSYYY